MRSFFAFILFSLFSFAASAQGSLGACGLHKGEVPMNGSGTLGQTYNTSACGLNYAQASVLTETRSQAAGFNTNGTGFPTTLAISGIPSCPTILKAYVWYTVSYQSMPAGSSVVINSTTVPATNIGQHGQKCWGESGTIVYRADVTANVTGNGNYNIDITGLGNKNWEVDGVTLMIIYKDNGATYQGSLVLWDGANTCSTGGCTINQTMNISPAVCGASTSGNAFLVVSDMQTASISPPQHSTTLNGATVTTYANNFYNFDIANTSVTAGQTTAPFGTAAINGSDCFCWSLMGLYYQTTSCTTCVPASVSLTVTPTPSTCGASNGAATVAASGAPAPYTYSWSTGASTTAINNLAAGAYSVTVTDATGCSAVQNFTITSSIGPAVTFTTTPVSCNGGSNGSASLNATGGTTPYTYGWVTTPPQTSPSVSGLTAGTYSVVVGDASGCSATYTVAITQPTALTATASVVNNALCNGTPDGNAIVNAAGGTGIYTYVWTPTAQNTQTASGLAAGSYSVDVTDANGCKVAQSVTITEPPAITLPTSSSVATCGKSDGTATVTPAGGTAPYTYLWLTTPAVQITPTASNLASGTYSVIVTDANGCLQNQSVVVPSGGSATADFYFTPDIVSLGEPTVTFSDASSGGISFWHWEFGDPNSGVNDTSSIQNPLHDYSDTGTYCITLIVSNATGFCTDTIVKCLKVEAQPTFYIPNTFTPNHDGKNEMFMAYGTYIKEFHMYVFDRWGNLIFESDDLYKGWDGTVHNNGKIVQEDVYVWKVRFIDTSDSEYNYVGHVNMVK